MIVDDLKAKVAQIAMGGGETAREKHLARGKLLPRDRVQMLLDPGTPFLEFSQPAAFNMYQGKRRCRCSAERWCYHWYRSCRWSRMRDRV